MVVPITVGSQPQTLAITGPFTAEVVRTVVVTTNASSAANITVTGAPSGVTFLCPLPLPSSNNCTLTVAAGTAYGVSTITVTVSAGTNTGATTFALELWPPFTVQFTASTIQVMEGSNSAPYVVTFTRAPDFTGAVTLDFTEDTNAFTATCSADLAGALPKTLVDSCALVIHSVASPHDMYAAALIATGGGHQVQSGLMLVPQDLILTGADQLIVGVPGQYLTEAHLTLGMSLRVGLTAEIIEVAVDGLPDGLDARCFVEEETEVSAALPMTETCTLSFNVAPTLAMGLQDSTPSLRVKTRSGLVREKPLYVETRGFEVQLAGGLNEATVGMTAGSLGVVQVPLFRRPVLRDFVIDAVLIQTPPEGITA